MHTQILSKNELVINTEEEKGEDEEGTNIHTHTQTNKKRMDMVNTEKRKEKQEVPLLNYQQIPLPCLRNKTNARQKTMKTTGRKVKAER